MYLVKTRFTEKYNNFSLYGDDSILIARGTKKDVIYKIIESLKLTGLFNYSEIPDDLKNKITIFDLRPFGVGVNIPITKNQYDIWNKNNLIIDVW